VTEREPYCLENRLNCCELGKVHDDDDDDDDDHDEEIIIITVTFAI